MRAERATGIPGASATPAAGAGSVQTCRSPTTSSSGHPWAPRPPPGLCPTTWVARIQHGSSAVFAVFVFFVTAENFAKNTHAAAAHGPPRLAGYGSAHMGRGTCKGACATRPDAAYRRMVRTILWQRALAAKKRVAIPVAPPGESHAPPGAPLRAGAMEKGCVP